VPSVLLITPVHDRYHTPADTAELVDARGVERVSAFAYRLLEQLAHDGQPIVFKAE